MYKYAYTVYKCMCFIFYVDYYTLILGLIKLTSNSMLDYDFLGFENVFELK